MCIKHRIQHIHNQHLLNTITLSHTNTLSTKYDMNSCLVMNLDEKSNGLVIYFYMIDDLESV